MRKALAMLLDLIVVVGLTVGLILLGLFFFVWQTSNILDLPNFIGENMNLIILIAYLLILFVLFFYFIAVPFLLSATFGQYIMGLYLYPDNRKGIFNLFLFYISSPILFVLFLPYTLWNKIRHKVSISHKISGLDLKATQGGFVSRAVTFLILIIIPVSSFYVAYKIYSDPSEIITKFIDYEKYLDKALVSKDYQTLSALLPKYLEKYGETDKYKIYKCVVLAQTSLTDELIDDAKQICGQALKLVKERKIREELLLAMARIFEHENLQKKAMSVYKTLWDNYEYRGIEMLDYIEKLARQDVKLAVNLLDSWLKANDIGSLSLQNLYSVAELYFQLQRYNKAINIYNLIAERTNITNYKAAALFRIGECYYQLKKYKEAKDYFSQAEKLDKYYTNLVESYIIDMKIKGVY